MVDHTRTLGPGAVLSVLLLMGCSVEKDIDPLRITWKDNMLAVRSDRLPGGKLEVWYLEAFCRKGSTDRDWSETVIPHETVLVNASPKANRLTLRTRVDGKVEIHHEIRAGADEVDFRLTLVNLSKESVDVEWAQPCIRVADFTGRGQDDYFEKCFLFTEEGLTRMHETYRETKARYVPGQVYVPEGINLNDVNPRPVSRTRPINGLVGCFSADESLILATAWDRTQELFQGVIVCIHSDFRIGGLAAGETKRLHGKLYLIENNIPALLERYERDFPAPR